MTNFLIGRVPAEQLEQIGEHVAQCDYCDSHLTQLDSHSDGVLDGLRRYRPPVVLWKTGSIIGEYEVIAPLGAGGMGRVWKARHRRMNRDVAIKSMAEIQDSQHPMYQRFQREVEALAAIRHPNVALAYDAGEYQGQPYLVMELLEGGDLSRVLAEKGPLSLPDACDCIIQAARGLQYAHQRGLIHRDVKPANLFRTNEGVIKLLDLGLVRLHNHRETNPASDIAFIKTASHSGLTSTTTIMGTLDYCAPEQLREAAAVDARADVYSLGCTFYALLTGSSPFARATPDLTIKAHQTEIARPLSALLPGIPIWVDGLIQQMLEKELSLRLKSMEDVVRLIESKTKYQRKLMRRLAVAGPIAAALLVIALGTVAYIQFASPSSKDLVREAKPSELRAPVERGVATEMQEKWAQHLGVPIHESNSVGLRMVLIPPGELEGRNAALKDPIRIAAYETTVSAFRQFVAATGYVTESKRSKGGWMPRYERKENEQFFDENLKWAWDTPGFAQTENHPVVHVSWNDSMAFCRWLSDREGVTYRLPSIAEANWAMLSGAGTRYYFGDDDKQLPDHAWIDSNSNRHTREVGFTKPNAWGLYDTLGNVHEWCTDWVEVEPRYYKFVTLGSYFDKPDTIQRQKRFHLDRGFSIVGFRLIRELK